MNFVTIGTSWITEKFIEASGRTENFSLYGVYSRDCIRAEAFRKKMNAKAAFSSFEAVAEDKNADAVYIASPNKCHYEQSRFFLLHGKNVICEKPATTTEEQMKELYEIAENNKLIYAEAVMSIHTPAFEILKEEINNIGKIRNGHFEFCQLSSKYGLYLEGKNPNIFNPELETGCLMDIGVYNIYLAAALFGEPLEIKSSAVMLPEGADACGSAILVYKDFILNLNYSKTGQTYSVSELTGDRGTILISSVSQLTGIRERTGEKEKELVTSDIPRADIMSFEEEYFRDMCITKNYSNEKYVFSKKTAFIVRRICDEIRKQNNFCF